MAYLFNLAYYLKNKEDKLTPHLRKILVICWGIYREGFKKSTCGCDCQLPLHLYFLYLFVHAMHFLNMIRVLIAWSHCHPDFLTPVDIHDDLFLSNLHPQPLQSSELPELQNMHLSQLKELKDKNR